MIPGVLLFCPLFVKVKQTWQHAKRYGTSSLRFRQEIVSDKFWEQLSLVVVIVFYLREKDEHLKQEKKEGNEYNKAEAKKKLKISYNVSMFRIQHTETACLLTAVLYTKPTGYITLPCLAHCTVMTVSSPKWGSLTYCMFLQTWQMVTARTLTWFYRARMTRGLGSSQQSSPKQRWGRKQQLTHT